MIRTARSRIRWLVPLLTLALGAAAVIWTSLEGRRVRRELDRVFEEHVHSVVRLIWESTREAARAIDVIYALSEEALAVRASLAAARPEDGEWLRASGLRVWLRLGPAGRFQGEWGPLGPDRRGDFVNMMRKAFLGEIVEGGPAGQNGLICARHLREGVDSIVCQEAAGLARLRRETGLGPLFREVASRGVVYAAIQDESGVLAASPGASLTGWEADPGLARARDRDPDDLDFRFLEGKRSLFEGLSPFPLPDGTTAVLRVAVDASHLDAIQQDIAWRHRLLYLVVGVLVLASLAGAWLAGRREKRRLAMESRLAAREEESRHWQTIGQMASSVAHEVRNPLNTLKMAAQRLKQEFAVPDAERPDYDKLIGLLQSQAERVNQVVSDFLQLGRPLLLEPEEVSLGEVLEKSLGPQRIRAAREGIQLVCDPVPEGTVRLDRQRFSQVIDNLVSNAFDAAGKGGRVRVQTRLDPEVFFLSVQDDGAGMDTGTLEKVQKPFVTTKARGTGLGLSIARRLVEAHGGHLELCSRPGEGTEARVVLPRTGFQGDKEVGG